jgi:hypothetical protein
MKKEFPDLSEEEITRRLIDYALKLHTQALERHTEEIVVKVLKRYKLIPE